MAIPYTDQGNPMIPVRDGGGVILPAGEFFSTHAIDMGAAETTWGGVTISARDEYGALNNGVCGFLSGQGKVFQLSADGACTFGDHVGGSGVGFNWNGGFWFADGVQTHAMVSLTDPYVSPGDPGGILWGNTDTSTPTPATGQIKPITAGNRIYSGDHVIGLPFSQYYTGSTWRDAPGVFFDLDQFALEIRANVKIDNADGLIIEGHNGGDIILQGTGGAQYGTISSEQSGSLKYVFLEGEDSADVRVFDTLTTRAYSWAGKASGTYFSGLWSENGSNIAKLQLEASSSAAKGWFTGGDFGFGVTTPGAPVEIRGPGPDTDAKLLISAPGQSRMRMQDITASEHVDFGITGSDGPAFISRYGTGGNDFYIYADGDIAMGMFGNVGIDELNPGKSLHVAGDVAIENDGPGIWLVDTAVAVTDEAYIVYDGDTVQFQRRATGFGAFEASPFGVEVQAASGTLWVDSNSRVGVLTTSPDNTLHVAGDAKFEDNIYAYDGSAYHGSIVPSTVESDEYIFLSGADGAVMGTLDVADPDDHFALVTCADLGTQYRVTLGSAYGSDSTCLAALRLISAGNNWTWIQTDVDTVEPAASNHTKLGISSVVWSELHVNGLTAVGGQVGVNDTSPSPSALSVVGNVNVAGTLTATSKSFLIDHPLAPTEKKLAHACIEGPGHILKYHGLARLKDGYAEIDIDSAWGMTPGTLGALCQGLAISTLQNQEGPAVAWPEKIKGGKFAIRADAAVNDLFFWEATAIRADAAVKWSDQNDDNGRLLVEIEKPEPTEEEISELGERDIQGYGDNDERREVRVDGLRHCKGYHIHPWSHGHRRPRAWRNVKKQDVTYDDFKPSVLEKPKKLDKLQAGGV